VDVSYISKNGEILVCENGKGLAFDEDLAEYVLQPDAIDILIDLHDGTEEATCWGCDLTYEYVKINGDYRT
jgi:glutamate N-acetyltransferase/amino-acid N-acetyltransferase